MRILALDHGSKRIGIAVSDELKVIAQPLEFIAAEPFADVLARLIRDASLRRTLAAQARTDARRFDYGVVARALLEDFAQLTR